MRFKKLLTMLMAGLMVVSACACGNGGGAGSSAAGSSASQSPAATSKAAGAGYEVTDMLGRKVTIPESAKTCVCIGPGALRLYCYVADKKNIAGVENIEAQSDEGRPYTMSFDNIKSLAIIGPGGPNNAPDAEKIFAAKPDVIFTCYNTEQSAVDELQDKTGIPVVAISYGEGRLFDETVYKSLKLIGQITKNEKRAQEVIDYFEAVKKDLEARVKDVTPVRVYLGGQSSKGNHGIESTTGDYEIFRVLNAKNVVNEKNITKYVMLDKEMLIELDPEYIIVDSGGLSLIKEDYKANPEYYKSLSAFKNKKIYLQMPFNHYTTNLDIAVADAYYIGSVLYPDKFKDVDPKAKFDEITNALLGVKVYDKIAATNAGGYQQVEIDK